MSRAKAQGTAWETEFVKRAQAAGLMAARLAEGGTYDPGDVWILDHPYPEGVDIPVLAWKRLVDGGGQNRVPLGSPAVVVISVPDFFTVLKLLDKGEIAFVAECKATEKLSVTVELNNARRKLKAWKERG